MILIGSQRGGAGDLARHLLKEENDHVTVTELRGFVADDLLGAFAEAHAVAKGTRCEQFLFSLSFNPPKNVACSLDDFRDAITRAETALGLTGQPRAVVIHEKNARRHVHVVWSRINAEKMTAINLPFFKQKLNTLARELYLERGWELPEGFRTNGWKNPLNFTLTEWQQAKRLDLDPREIKQVFDAAWQSSDGLASLRNALEEHGYFLAKGDRRGVVAVSITGDVFAFARWAGVKTKDVRQRLGAEPDLPTVDQVKARTADLLRDKFRANIRDEHERRKDEIRPIDEQRMDLVKRQRFERERLNTLQQVRRIAETKARAERFRKGLAGVWDILTGAARATRREVEQDAFRCYRRDVTQREELTLAHLQERKVLQDRMDGVRKRHRAERANLMRAAARAMKNTENLWARPGRDRSRNPSKDIGFEP